jgi:hypothetical protein
MKRFIKNFGELNEQIDKSRRGPGFPKGLRIYDILYYNLDDFESIHEFHELIFAISKEFPTFEVTGLKKGIGDYMELHISAQEADMYNLQDILDNDIQWDNWFNGQIRKNLRREI